MSLWTVFQKCICKIWVCIWLKLIKVCVREYRNCLAVHCAKTKSPNVTDVIQCIRWLVKVQSLYIVWHQHMRAYAYTLAYAGTRWYTLVVRQAYVVYVPNTLTFVGVRCVIGRDQIFFGHVRNLSAYASVQNIRYSYANHTHGIRWIR